jgi:hypothetical protein
MIIKVKPIKLIAFIALALAYILVLAYILFPAFNGKGIVSSKPFLVFIVVLFIFFLIPFFLSITYIIEDLNKTVQFDYKNQILVVKKKNEIINIKKNDIIAAYQVIADDFIGVRLNFPWYKYVLIIKKGRKIIFITNLLCNPEEVFSFFKIKYKTINWFIPFISRSIGSEFLTTEEVNEKVMEYEEFYKDYSTDQLEDIVKNSKTYTEQARQAASNLLNRKN